MERMHRFIVSCTLIICAILIDHGGRIVLQLLAKMTMNTERLLKNRGASLHTFLRVVNGIGLVIQMQGGNYCPINLRSKCMDEEKMSELITDVEEAFDGTYEVWFGGTTISHANVEVD